MTADPQFVLPFVPLMSTGRADFLVAPANREAAGWVDRWPDWQSHGLVIAGPVGSGKSHLAAVWRDRAAAGWIDGADLDTDDIPTLTAAHAAWVVDNADRAAPRPLLHLYNLLIGAGGWLLLTARVGPKEWGIKLADLASRLAILPVAAIGAPDDALMHAVLVKLFADRQLDVGADVIAYLAVRLERSFEMLQKLTVALDAAALSRQRPITIPLARDVLASILQA